MHLKNTVINNKKIVMLNCMHFVSGIGRYGYELARHIKYYNNNLLLYKPHSKNSSDAHYIDIDWIKPIRYKSLKNLRPYIFPYFAAAAILNQNADVYHAHWFLGGLGMMYARKKPLVITLHDASLLHIPEGDKKFIDFFASTVKKFKKQEIPVIVVSETAKIDTINYANYPAELVHAVPNGIDFNFFKPIQKITKEKFTIIYTGGLGKRKNVDLILKAFQKLEKKYDFVELKIAGSYPQYTPYPELANSLGLKNVIFTDFIPDDKMNEFYNEGDLMIYTSEYEGFGFAPLEAMACGVPVLCVNGGSLAEISGGGTVHIEYDAEDIFLKAGKIIDDYEFRRTIILKGSEWVKQYTWDNTALKTMAVYEKAIMARR